MKRALLSAALAALALAGCSGIEPVIPVEDRRMVVIPFRDHVNWHYESARGNTLARYVTERLARAHEEDDSSAVAVVPTEELVRALGNDDPKKIPFAEIGRRTQADLVLVGSLVRFDTRRKGDVGFLRGQARAEVVVLETARPEKPIYKTTIDALFPPEDFANWGGMAGEEGAEDEIAAGLIASLGEKIARLFYEHEPARDERPR